MNNKNTIRIAGIVNDSITDGPGIRLAVFAQGCTHNCLGCHNPETHELYGGHLITHGQIIKMIYENPLLDGVTFSGGEPFLQAASFAELGKSIKSIFQNLNIITYSGYTWEKLLTLPDSKGLLEISDYIIDGPFILSQRSLELKFKGSKNQRTIDVKKSLSNGLTLGKLF